MARDWVSASEIQAACGLPPIDAQRHVSQAKAWGEDDATVVAPLTFNTLNKWAAGIADNYALGVLNESISLARKTIAIPMIGHRFWNHPARSQSTALLSKWVTFLDPAVEGVRMQAVPSGSGPSVAAAFALDRILACLRSLGARYPHFCAGSTRCPDHPLFVGEASPARTGRAPQWCTRQGETK